MNGLKTLLARLIQKSRICPSEKKKKKTNKKVLIAVD